MFGTPREKEYEEQLKEIHINQGRLQVLEELNTDVQAEWTITDVLNWIGKKIKE